MAPCLESVAYSEELLFARCVVNLHCYKLAGVEGYGAEGSADSKLTSIGNYYGLSFRVEGEEYRC
eukprot:2892976-Rhodomonas_salina.1